MPTCDAGDVTSYRIRVEGPAELTLDVATAIADADGIDLIASDQPVAGDAGTITLDVTVEGPFDAVTGAVAHIRAGLPTGASIALLDG